MRIKFYLATELWKERLSVVGRRPDGRLIRAVTSPSLRTCDYNVSAVYTSSERLLSRDGCDTGFPMMLISPSPLRMLDHSWAIWRDLSVHARNTTRHRSHSTQTSYYIIEKTKWPCQYSDLYYYSAHSHVIALILGVTLTAGLLDLLAALSCI